MVALATVSTAAPSAARSAEPLVLALYYPWYNWDTWEDPVLSDIPAEPYHGSDPATIHQHVLEARAAGIDVLVSAWFGPTGDNPTESSFRTLLDEAQAQGMRAALLLETDDPNFFPSWESQRHALSYALTVHAQHPAYLQEAGKPAIFVWRPRSIWQGGQRVGRDGAPSIDAWRDMREQVDPGHQSVWLAETDSSAYLDIFDGVFFYNVAGLVDPAGVLSRVGANVRAAEDRTGEEKVWIGTAMPGYDDSRLLDRRDRFSVDRAAGEFYERTFDAAASSDPDWILIVSFNEWVEGHQIEPSVTYGDLYLGLTHDLTQEWKAEVAGAQAP
jgi:hypothetical protein